MSEGVATAASAISKIKVPQLGGSNNPPILQATVLAGGGFLVLSAVYNLDPIQAIKNLFTGKNPLDAKYNPGAHFPTGAGSGISGSVPNGGSAPKGETQGSGTWVKSDPGSGWSWSHFYTQAEAKAAHITVPAPPGASPPWRWSVGQGKWLDQRTLTGDSYNPHTTPGGSNAPRPQSSGSGGQTITGQPASLGGSDPGGTLV